MSKDMEDVMKELEKYWNSVSSMNFKGTYTGEWGCGSSATSTPKKDGSIRVAQVIFNPPTTIVKWSDGTKTIVRTDEKDVFNEEVGLAMAIVRKIYGTRSAFQKLVESADRQLPKVEKKEKKAK